MDAALTFTAIQEPSPSAERILALMPALSAWYLRDGDAARPSFYDARRALQQHMPELFPTWEALCERAGGGDVASRVLSLFDPPPLLAGCSQAVIGGASPAIRISPAATARPRGAASMPRCWSR